jgi:hypothetical protein
VRLDGVEHAPREAWALRLGSSGSLVLPDPGGPLAEPELLDQAGAFVGLEFDTLASTGPLRVAELVLDGQLETATAARCGANVRLYDVTPGEGPRLLAAESFTTSPRNDRSFFAPDWLLKPSRAYRLGCRVSERRASPLAPNPGTPALANRGGFSGSAENRCDDAVALAASLDPGLAFLELRYRSATTGRQDRTGSTDVHRRLR